MGEESARHASERERLVKKLFDEPKNLVQGLEAELKHLRKASGAPSADWFPFPRVSHLCTIFGGADPSVAAFYLACALRRAADNEELGRHVRVAAEVLLADEANVLKKHQAIANKMFVDERHIRRLADDGFRELGSHLLEEFDPEDHLDIRLMVAESPWRDLEVRFLIVHKHVLRPSPGTVKLVVNPQESLMEVVPHKGRAIYSYADDAWDVTGFVCRLPPEMLSVYTVLRFNLPYTTFRTNVRVSVHVESYSVGVETSPGAVDVTTSRIDTGVNDIVSQYHNPIYISLASDLDVTWQ